MRKTYITALISAIILGLSVNIWAYPPFSETSFIEDDLHVADCDGFTVRTLATTRVTETFFFDRDGNPVRLRISAHVTDSIYYNSVDPTIYIQQGASGAGENGQFLINLVTGTVQVTGAVWRITLKGIGPLFIDVGRHYWDGDSWAISGTTIFPEAGTGSALCEALAP